MALKEKPESTPTDIPTINDGDEFVAGAPEGVVAPDGSTIADAEVFDPEFNDDNTPVAVAESNADAPLEDPAAPTKADRQKALTEVYGEATKQLRINHQKEFDQLRVKLASDRGITWAPRESAQEKKIREIREALEADPSLRKALDL